MKRQFSLNKPVKIFLVLSAFDFLLTSWLLFAHGQYAYESNPFARWWFDQFGFFGLAGFKSTCVLVVLGVCTLLLRKSPRVSNRLLLFGSAVLLGVIGYSGYLIGELTVWNVYMNNILHERKEIVHNLNSGDEYRQTVHELAHNIHNGEITLRDAVNRLVQLDHAKNPKIMDVLKFKYKTDCVETCMAQQMAYHYEQIFGDSIDRQVQASLYSQLFHDFDVDHGMAFLTPSASGTPATTPETTSTTNLTDSLEIPMVSS